MSTKHRPTDEIDVRQKEPLNLMDSGIIVDPEIVEVEDLRMLHAEELLFNEEPCTIILHKQAVEHAPMVQTFFCNGQQVDIPVNEPVTIRRKFVSIIARSIRETVNTVVVDDGITYSNQLDFNRIRRFPFTPIAGFESPRAQQWLRNEMAA
jgi:hypothetical protein